MKKNEIAKNLLQDKSCDNCGFNISNECCKKHKVLFKRDNTCKDWLGDTYLKKYLDEIVNKLIKEYKI